MAARQSRLLPPNSCSKNVEHVERVQKDRRGQQRGRIKIGRPPQPLKVDHRQTREDDQTQHRIDHGAAGDLHEDQHDAEPDQGKQRPEAHPRDTGQIGTGGIAERAAAGDEQRRHTTGLPQGLRVGTGVVDQCRRHREPEQQPHCEQQHDTEAGRAAHGEPHADQADKKQSEKRQAPSGSEITAEVATQRKHSGGRGHVPHDLTEQGARAVADAELAVIGCVHRVSFAVMAKVCLNGESPAMGAATKWGGQRCIWEQRCCALRRVHNCSP